MLNRLLNKLFGGEKSSESGSGPVPNSATAAIAENLGSTKKISYDTTKNTLTIDMPKLTGMQDDENIVKYIEEIKNQNTQEAVSITINTDSIINLDMIHHIVNELKAEKKMTILFNLDFATYYGTEVGRLQDIKNLAQAAGPGVSITIYNRETGQSLIVDENFIASKSEIIKSRVAVPIENKLTIQQTGNTIQMKSLTLNRSTEEQKTIDQKLAEIITNTPKDVNLELQFTLLKPTSKISYVLGTLLKAHKQLQKIIFIIDETEFNEEEEIDDVGYAIHDALDKINEQYKIGYSDINIIVRNKQDPQQEKPIINQYKK